MLILTRRVNERIMIGDDIEVMVMSVKGNQVRLGIKAPKGLGVHREEVYERIQQETIARTEAEGVSNVHG